MQLLFNNVILLLHKHFFRENYSNAFYNSKFLDKKIVKIAYTRLTKNCIDEFINKRGIQ